MRDDQTNRMRMAGVAVAAGIGVSGFLAVLTASGDGPDDRRSESVDLAAAEADEVVAENGHAGSDGSDASSSSRRPSSTGAVGTALATGDASGSAASEAQGSESQDSESQDSGSQEPGAEQVEVVIPHRVIVTLPHYQPGTPPTVHRPTAFVTPPGVTHEGSRIVIDLPSATATPPSVEMGQPGRLTPPSVDYE